jgi:UDP-glucose 4-epimerase
LTPSERRVGTPDGVVVVGGGFIGSHVTRVLVGRGVRTTVLTRRPPRGGTADRLSGARLVIGDAADSDVVRAAVGDAEQVVWCVGGLLPAESNQRKVEDLVTSLPPLLAMLDLLADRGGGSLVFISSGGTVYGNPTVLPVPEHHVTRPVTSHGVMKRTAELYLDLYRELHGVRAVALRCANVYGHGQRPNRSQGIVATALHRTWHDQPVPVFGDGSVVRDYIHVDDVADVVATVAGRTEVPAVLNVGTGVGTTVRDLLGLVGEVTGRRVRTEHRDPRPGDVQAVVLDVTLLRSLLGFEPIGLSEGLARTAPPGPDTIRLVG